MKPFVDRFRKEEGLTLIEMIAAITLSAIIIGVISGVMMFGVRSYHKIRIENALRDEADLIMSSIITELYTFAPEQVRNMPNGNGVILTGAVNGTAAIHSIAIVQDKLVIDKGDGSNGADPDDSITDNRYSLTAIDSDLSNSKISFQESSLCRSGVSCDSGLIDITLNLERNYADRVYTMELKSKFGF